MSKGPKIKPRILEVITREALKDRNKPRGQLAVELQKIIESMGEIAPALDTLEKQISTARNHAPSPLDAPFSLASLTEYDIAPEALPAVLRVWKLNQALGNPFSIRQAKWVARLYAVIPDTLDQYRDDVAVF